MTAALNASGCERSEAQRAPDSCSTFSAVAGYSGATDEISAADAAEEPFPAGFHDCPRAIMTETGEYLSTVTEDGLTVYMKALTTEDGLTFRDPNGTTWIAGYYPV
jgi:hypothetical protein